MLIFEVLGNLAFPVIIPKLRKCRHFFLGGGLGGLQEVGVTEERK